MMPEALKVSHNSSDIKYCVSIVQDLLPRASKEQKKVFTILNKNKCF